VPLSVGELGPHLTVSPGPRPTSVPNGMLILDPSRRLAAHNTPTLQTDRQTTVRYHRAYRFTNGRPKTQKVLNQINKRTKTKPKPTLNFKNCLDACAYHCAQLSYIHNTAAEEKVKIILPLILRTIIIALMMSTGGEGTQTSESDKKFSRCRANNSVTAWGVPVIRACSKHTPPPSAGHYHTLGN